MFRRYSKGTVNTAFKNRRIDFCIFRHAFEQIGLFIGSPEIITAASFQRTLAQYGRNLFHLDPASAECHFQVDLVYQCINIFQLQTSLYN